MIPRDGPSVGAVRRPHIHGFSGSVAQNLPSMMLNALNRDAASAAPRSPIRELHAGLLDRPDALRDDARDFLDVQLRYAAELPDPLPTDPAALRQWSLDGSAEAGRRFQDYLAKRRAGGKRRYFASRSHALYFLRGVAPTKLVDGAWLSGLLPYWPDQRFHPLIRTYLEELGEGDPSKNHVLLYRRLLAAHGCEQLDTLDDEHYLQGAIQLSLGAVTDEFLPELIGYNLGYEQLPLHLLITAYELRELGIDPYYFTLHVTVDNAGSGHGYQAVRALQGLLPAASDNFYRRVRAGSRLNDLGESTLSVIDGFELRRELETALAAKAEIGAQLHSDRCRIGGRSVPQWLSEPGRIGDFLDCLVETGWVRRGEPPENSRFWRLIQGERAAMFGVFTQYEQELL